MPLSQKKLRKLEAFVAAAIALKINNCNVYWFWSLEFFEADAGQAFTENPEAWCKIKQRKDFKYKRIIKNYVIIINLVHLHLISSFYSINIIRKNQ